MTNGKEPKGVEGTMLSRMAHFLKRENNFSDASGSNLPQQLKVTPTKGQASGRGVSIVFHPFNLCLDIPR